MPKRSNRVDQKVPWEKVNALDFRALQAGEADSDQQKRALDFLLNVLCQTYQPSYRPESDRATVFAEGRRAVGLNIVTMLTVRLDMMKTEENKQ